MNLEMLYGRKDGRNKRRAARQKRLTVREEVLLLCNSKRNQGIQRRRVIGAGEIVIK